MGRGVEVLDKEYGVAYYDLSISEQDFESYIEDYKQINEIQDIDNDIKEDLYNDIYNDNYEITIENISELLETKYKSLKPSQNWLTNESRVILENKMIYVVISEYCNLMSFCVVLKNSEYNYASSFAYKVGKYLSSLSSLKRIGGFSDGTSIYEKN